MQHIVDRVEHARTRPKKVEPKKKRRGNPIDGTSNIRSRYKRKYTPRNGTEGRRNMRHLEAGKGLPEDRWSSATEFITTMADKSVEHIIEHANKLTNLTPVLMILDKLAYRDNEKKDHYQSLREIVRSIYEGKGETIGPITVVLADEAGKIDARGIVDREAEILRKYYQDSTVWTESIEDCKRNIVKYYARAELKPVAFVEALNEGRVLKKYYNANI
jgi:hypothetical protein